MDSSRKRPFTEFERTFLINLITEYSNIIENRKTDGSTLLQKTTAWANITEKFNESTMVTRKVDAKQLKKFWNNLKTKSREAKTKENQRNFTGGGPSIPDMDVEHEQVLSVVPNILPVIKVADSDAIEGEDGDDDAYHWSHKKTRTNEVHDEELDKEIVTIIEICDTTLPTTATDTMPGPSTDTQMEVQNTPSRPLPTEPAAQQQSAMRRQRGQKRSIDDIKRSILERDMIHREQKFKIEVNHLRKVHSIELEQKNMELEHKKKMFHLLEEEMKLKINILKNKND